MASSGTSVAGSNCRSQRSERAAASPAGAPPCAVAWPATLAWRAHCAIRSTVSGPHVLDACDEAGEVRQSVARRAQLEAQPPPLGQVLLDPGLQADCGALMPRSRATAGRPRPARCMVELGVDHRGVQRAMPQHVGHLLDRAALLTSRHASVWRSEWPRPCGMPARRKALPMRRAWRPRRWARHAALGGARTPSRWWAWVVRVAGTRPAPRPVAAGRGSTSWRRGLRALERDGAGAPVDVGQLQPGDLAAAQAQVERQAHDG